MSRLNRTGSLVVLVATLAVAPGMALAQESPQPEGSPSPQPSVVALPQQEFPTREESDAYWMGLKMGGEMLGYGSVADIVDASDLIIVGRPTGLRFYLTDEGVEGPDGNTYGVQSYMLMTVTIDDLIYGTPKSEVAGTVDVLVDLAFETTVEDWLANLPTAERSLFVLQNLGRLNQEVGAPAEEIARTQTIYARLNDPQGQVRDIDGVAVSLPVDQVVFSSFPQEYEGRPFDEMVQALRRVARKAGV